jgi:16S rRNA G966 N2-methylase RsmD
VASAGLRTSGVRSEARVEDAVAGVGRAGAEALGRDVEVAVVVGVVGQAEAEGRLAQTD